VSRAPAELETDFLLADGRRPVAGAVLVARDGRVLLQLRDDKPGIDAPGQWSLFGGGMDERELPEAGMLREVAEEVGYSVRHYRPLLVFDGWRGRYHIYLAAIDAPLERMTLTEGAGFDYWRVPDILAETRVSDLLRLSLAALEALQRQRAAANPGAELIPGAGY
jgi:8-oxo-dGTP diphosphatase